MDRDHISKRIARTIDPYVQTVDQRMHKTIVASLAITIADEIAPCVDGTCGCDA